MEWIKEEFNVDDHGIITDPGKFEREPWWVPYYWSFDGEDDAEFTGPEGMESEIRIFYVSEWEALKSSDLETGDVIYLWEDDQGFVRNEVNPE
mgnify:CR=1 FL=1